MSREGTLRVPARIMSALPRLLIKV
jgi:hypothetical protein